ncbi:MAG: SurA N-terminal domain-containing protein [Rhizorhabdus sp.]|nr:SurA N-terminal domain-containing protein [Rhizorhabdus sp.]
MKVKAALLSGAVAAGLLLTGCHKEPKGQILAIVNGEEISMQELNAELQGARIPDNADRAKIRKEVLQRLIDRKLIVQKAREQGLDKTPEFVAQQRRLEENLLVSLLGQKIAATVPMPDDRDITQYIADNPSQFSGRQRLLLDQIQFAAPKDPKQLLMLRDAHSLDDVAAGVQKLGLAMSRGKGVIDTGRLDPQMVKIIDKLPPGEPFVLPSNGQYVASVIVGRDSTPTPGNVARLAAAEVVRRKALVAESKAQVARARTGAEIQYQPGYEPDKSAIKASQAKAAEKK